MRPAKDVPNASPDHVVPAMGTMQSENPDVRRFPCAFPSMVLGVSHAEEISDAKRSDDKGDDDKAEFHRILLFPGSPDPIMRYCYRCPDLHRLRERECLP